MGWRGRGWSGQWPGRGPFSYLPPWQRPGWLYGRGACWHLPFSYLVDPYYAAPVPAMKPEDESRMLAEQRTLLEEQVKDLQEAMRRIEVRLEELKK